MTDNEKNVQFLLRSMRPTNAYEETMQRLLQSIRLGMVSPGERLPAERDLASMLKVSRDTVREALGTLVEQQYVVSKRGRYGGTFVSDVLPQLEQDIDSRKRFTEEELEDIMVLRGVLEVGAARAAAGRGLRAEDREELAEALDATSQASAQDYRRIDSRLHLLIAELTGSQSLLRMAVDLRVQVNDVLGAIPVLAVNLANANEQHALIVNAILKGKPDVAAKAMLDHVEGTGALMHGYLTSSLS